MPICGTDCCARCPKLESCGGCEKVNGHPFGGTCVAAECIRREGMEAFQALKRTLIREINALNIPGLQVNDLYLLSGEYLNLKYPLPSGKTVQLLDDRKVYLGNQIEIAGSDRCYGVVADESNLLVSTYECGGSQPEILLYKSRK